MEWNIYSCYRHQHGIFAREKKPFVQLETQNCYEKSQTSDKSLNKLSYIYK